MHVCACGNVVEADDGRAYTFRERTCRCRERGREPGEDERRRYAEVGPGSQVMVRLTWDDVDRNMAADERHSRQLRAARARERRGRGVRLVNR